MVEQCILVKCGQDVVKSRTVVILSWEGYFWQFVVSFYDVFNEIHLFIFIFFPATRVNICSQPVRETCNQFGMASGKWSLPVMLIVDLSLARVVQHSPFQFYALPTLELSLGSMVQCGRTRMRMTTITLRVQNLTLSSLK